MASRVLQRAFGAEFGILHGSTGEPICYPPSPPGGNWLLWSAECGEVARRQRPELLQEEQPLVVLALPLPGRGGECWVAVGVFVTRPVAPDEDISAAARAVGLEPRAAREWACRQTPWPPELLERTATVVMDQLLAAQRISQLEKEAESLSDNLAATYEEISLLYRITQNLKISKSDEDLSRAALEWMGGVVPAEGLAIQLVPVAEEGESLTQRARTRSVLVSLGDCPVDNEQFTRLVEHLGLKATGRPRVLNGATTGEPGWPFPRIRQMIAVPMAEGENLFGWLAAFNHVRGGEFGSVEASLLYSVGTIVGIHSGNTELYRQQSELLAGVVRALTSAIDAKDPYTCGHSDRVARVAVRIAREMGMEGESLNTIYLSGLLHDIGKIGISDSVLRKPGNLTDWEFQHIKTHVEIGHKILLDLKKLDDILPVVLHHHESWDGRGYPDRLTAEKIPLPARIVAVADSFDAMNSDRPYRKGLPDDKIDETFRAGAGRQWDPDVIDAFFRAREDIRRIVNAAQEEIAAGVNR